MTGVGWIRGQSEDTQTHTNINVLHCTTCRTRQVVIASCKCLSPIFHKWKHNKNKYNCRGDSFRQRGGELSSNWGPFNPTWHSCWREGLRSVQKERSCFQNWWNRKHPSENWCGLSDLVHKPTLRTFSRLNGDVRQQFLLLCCILCFLSVVTTYTHTERHTHTHTHTHTSSWMTL